MSRAKKETAASLIASGQVRITKTPEQVNCSESWTLGQNGVMTVAQFYSDAPPKWLRPVKPPHQMSQKELDKELDAIYRRLSSSAASSGYYGHHEGLQPSEIVLEDAIAA